MTFLQQQQEDSVVWQLCCILFIDKKKRNNHILVQMQICDNRGAETSWVGIVLTREGDSSKHIGTALYVCMRSSPLESQRHD